MAWGAGTWYRPYVSKLAHSPATTTWLQIDLGARRAIDSFRLYQAITPGDPHANGFGFPLRFRIEVSDDASFVNSKILADCSASDVSEADVAFAGFDRYQRSGGLRS
jgi:hypothetical protein